MKSQRRTVIRYNRLRALAADHELADLRGRAAASNSISFAPAALAQHRSSNNLPVNQLVKLFPLRWLPTTSSSTCGAQTHNFACDGHHKVQGCHRAAVFVQPHVKGPDVPGLVVMTSQTLISVKQD